MQFIFLEQVKFRHRNNKRLKLTQTLLLSEINVNTEASKRFRVNTYHLLVKEPLKR